MIESTLRGLVRYQIWHLLSLGVLLFVVVLYLRSVPQAVAGSWWGTDTTAWFYATLAVAILHQVYVWLIWRLELYGRVLTKRLRVHSAFNLYAVGFLFLLAGRAFTLGCLAISNRGSLSISLGLAYSVVTLVGLLGVYLVYSIIRYFTLRRAMGLDHFVPGFEEPLVKRGIFRHTGNAMYTFGMLLFYLPGLIFQSQSALVAAAFYHVYIWVHYCFTERPDLKQIYGSTR